MATAVLASTTLKASPLPVAKVTVAVAGALIRPCESLAVYVNWQLAAPPLVAVNEPSVLTVSEPQLLLALLATVNA